MTPENAILALRRPDAEPRSEPPDASDPRMLRVAAAAQGLLDALDLPRHDPHLTGTARRMARAFGELFAGLAQEGPDLRTFPNPEGYADPVSVTGVPFYSICAHHFLPFFGLAHVAYLPGDRLVGLSKLARAVEFYARRPQVQERLTEQVAALLDARLAPRGVMVVLEARHLCMEMRGVRRPRVVTTTTAVRGAFGEPQRRREFLTRIASTRQEGDA